MSTYCENHIFNVILDNFVLHIYILVFNETECVDDWYHGVQQQTVHLRGYMFFVQITTMYILFRDMTI